MKQPTSFTATYRTKIRQFAHQAGAFSFIDWGRPTSSVTTIGSTAENTPLVNSELLSEEVGARMSSTEVQKSWQEGQLERMRSHIA